MAPNETYVNEFLEIASFVTHSSNILCRYDNHSDNFVSFHLLPDETCSFAIFVPVSCLPFNSFLLNSDIWWPLIYELLNTLILYWFGMRILFHLSLRRSVNFSPITLENRSCCACWIRRCCKYFKNGVKIAWIKKTDGSRLLSFIRKKIKIICGIEMELRYVESGLPVLNRTSIRVWLPSSCRWVCLVRLPTLQYVTSHYVAWN